MQVVREGAAGRRPWQGDNTLKCVRGRIEQASGDWSEIFGELGIWDLSGRKDDFFWVGRNLTCSTTSSLDFYLFLHLHLSI